ncbi:MAG TPA: NAD(P)-dependent oxidoreductase [Candidatus Acidoferrum sp.]|nr:NAD(P)-dependent oxidoreductase [Candidatus Acidoferrum sp.]
MNSNKMTRGWSLLRSEARVYPWKDTFLRMSLDFLLVNASFLAAVALWFLFYVVVLRVPDPQGMAERFKSFVVQYWLLWSSLALLVFQLTGMYPRTRGLRAAQKSVVVFRAVSLFIVLFIFADYFLYRGALAPRGVAALGWLLTLLAVGGSRLIKHGFLKSYNVEHRTPPEKVKHVLVLGGAGYLGAVLVPQLLERGFRVRVLDSFLFGERSLDGVKLHQHFELVRGDVRDIAAVVQAMRGCDAVVHLAAIVGDSACEENKQLAMEVNRAATRMLVDVARGCGVRRFVFASSCSVYGASDLPVSEGSALAPLSLYAQTKVDSENILLAAKMDSLAPTVLRLGTLFGLSGRMRFDLVVNLFVARAVSTGRITVLNGEQWRPFLHVRDAGHAIVECLEAAPRAVSGEIFNVGTPSLNLQIRGLGEAVARIIPSTTIDETENADRRNYRVSFEKIQRTLGFQCQQSLEAGIKEMYGAIRSGVIGDLAPDRTNNQIAIRAVARASGGQLSPLGQLAVLARVEGKRS